jgi:hypothetical protein
MKLARLALTTASVALACMWQANAQVIGSYDNFDCFNDTGEEAEGFEIDVEDISPSDLTREFPSNFSSTPWVIRYGLPTVTAYDYTSTPPDSQHPYDAGHKGVLITWAATWNGSAWTAQYGAQPFGASTAGNGTLYLAKPTYTNGDSCWYYGLGNAYPTSGCDHFGISFAPGVAPGKLSYHWKIPDTSNPGNLINGANEASLPPSPGLALNPPVVGQQPVVHVVAEAPENPEPQWGPAYWVKVTSLYGKQDAVLDNLQKANVKNAKVKKVVTWTFLQRPPAGVVGEKEDAEDDNIPAGNVQVTKQFEYFAFAGVYDSETHEALCDTAYGSAADAVAGTNPIGDSCTNTAGNMAPLVRSYWQLNPANDSPDYIKGGNKGKYIGAHINAYNAQ